MSAKFNTKDITQPKPGLMVFHSAYWACVDGDPSKALFYGTSPQCNPDERIVLWGLRKENFYPENTKCVFVKISYVPQRT